MRRIFGLLTAIILTLCLCVTAFAANDVERAGLIATVSEDGSCQINLNLTLQMDQADRSMRYPIPENAQNVLLNGSPVGTYSARGVQQVDLSGVITTGATLISFNLQYTITDIVKDNQVQLPLLSGFQLPVSYMDFTVRMPGEIAGKPAFTSTYHQSNIEKDLSWNYAGDTITGRTLSQIKDYETLVLLIPVSSGMFANAAGNLFSTQLDEIGMWVCGVLAVLYWLVFLWVLPPKLSRCTQPPQGYTAGNLGSVLTLEGADLSLMVLSWAQMGYVIIEARRDHKVRLHYAMGMGNERSEFEQRIFTRLFSKRPTVDTDSLQYALLCKNVAAQAGHARVMANRRSGNPRIFRILTVMVGLFAGLYAGLSLPFTGFGQVITVLAYCVAGLLCAWGIQLGTQGLLLWRPHRLKAGVAGLVFWLILSLLAGCFSFGLTTALLQLLFGFMGTYGGRRTEEGKRNLQQVLSLRKYLRTLDAQSIARIQAQDPEFFYNMVPYALALGVDGAFARRFGKEILPECPYLIGLSNPKRNAAEYSLLLRQIVDAMDARYRQLSKEQLSKAIITVRK